MNAVEILGKIYINKYAFGCVLHHFPHFYARLQCKNYLCL